MKNPIKFINSIIKLFKNNRKKFEEINISYLNKNKERPNLLYLGGKGHSEKEPICYTKITIYLRHPLKN